MENKKGALELSINAIVIIVIAITVLGLSLVFVRQMFVETSETTFSVMKGTDLTKLVNPPSRDNALTVTPASIELRRSETKEVGVAFMNTEPSGYTYSLSVDDTSGSNLGFIYSIPGNILQPDEIGYWKIVVKPASTGTSTTSVGTYIVTVKINGDPLVAGTDPVSKQADIVIKVNS